VLALLAMMWTGAPGDVRADTIVLKSGEAIEGSIIDATRNTVIVQRAMGGMRQMPIRDIAEVRIELAQGQRIAGQLLSWADGVYQVRSGGQVMRIAEGDILSREAGAEAPGQPPRDVPPRPIGPQTVRMAAAPATPAPEDTAADRAVPAHEPMTAQETEGEDRTQAASDEESVAAVDENQSPVGGEEPNAAGGEEQSLAALDENQSPATGEKQSLAVRASVDPAEPGAANMVFKIELSRPAEQTVVLIYGTVEGTAKAGEDFEPKQGIVTLAPGSESAEVHVPLIASPSKGEKSFELFLTADPKVAEIVDRRIIATINGDD
jgi:RNase P/RNase MRP subunit p29